MQGETQAMTRGKKSVQLRRWPEFIPLLNLHFPHFNFELNHRRYYPPTFIVLPPQNRQLQIYLFIWWSHVSLFEKYIELETKRVKVNFISCGSYVTNMNVILSIGLRTVTEKRNQCQHQMRLKPLRTKGVF